MQEISYRELINRDELQRLQDEFCAAVGVIAYSLDENGGELTSASGDMAEEIVQQYIASGYVRDVLERVEEGSLEDLAVENVEATGGRLAAMAIRAESGTVMYWVAISPGRDAENARFENVLDLLRDASYALIDNKVSCFSAQMENERSITTQEEIDRELKAIEATTEILQLLDSDETIERIMAQMLRVVGSYLHADTAQIFQLRADDQFMDVLSEWLNVGYSSRFKKTDGIETAAFLKNTKPQVLTIDGPAGDYHSDLVRLGVQAVMVFPVLRQENANTMVLSLVCRDSRPKWGMQEVKFASDVVKVLQSILTKRIQKNAIASSRAALETILDNVGNAIYVTDLETGERLYANDKLQRQFVMELQDGSFPELLKEAMEKGTDNSHEFYHADVERWYKVVHREMAWVDARRANLYILIDITEEKEYEKRLAWQAKTDPLTGLYNRECMEQVLEADIEEARNTNSKGALLYVDLDEFKRINDGLGHQYGDEVLKSVSESLQEIEEIEKACYRVGGDEFMILVPPKYFSRLARIKRDIQRIFESPWYLRDAYHTCTMSMGVIVYPDAGEDVAQLLAKADLAVYEAKRSGKNTIVTYESGADSASERRWNMEQNMRAAIADNFSEFYIVYQPVMEITSVGCNCVGAEALLRWRNAELGEVPLEEFLPLAEHLGLINPIGNYVLHTACKDCKQWNDTGAVEFKVSVNLSAVQLMQTDIVEIVDETVRAIGLRPENLILDVKEDLAVSDQRLMKEVMEGLRLLGVQVALDDFGTGVSSLSHLQELPFNIVKIGQDFTKKLGQDAYVQAFVQMMDRVSAARGIKTVVEGVETPEVVETLRLMKAHYAQGFAFGQTTDKDAFEEKYVVSVEFI